MKLFYSTHVILFLLLLTSSTILAQSKIIPDNRLFIKYNVEYLSNLSEKNPETLDYLNFTLDNSCYLINEDGDKFKNCTQLELYDNTNKAFSKVFPSSIELSELNILNYNIELSYNQRTFYRIGNSTKILAFYSLKEMADRYNQYKKSVK